MFKCTVASMSVRSKHIQYIVIFLKCLLVFQIVGQFVSDVRPGH